MPKKGKTRSVSPAARALSLDTKPLLLLRSALLILLRAVGWIVVLPTMINGALEAVDPVLPHLVERLSAKVDGVLLHPRGRTDGPDGARRPSSERVMLAIRRRLRLFASGLERRAALNVRNAQGPRLLSCRVAAVAREGVTNSAGARKYAD